MISQGRRKHKTDGTAHRGRRPASASEVSEDFGSLSCVAASLPSMLRLSRRRWIFLESRSMSRLMQRARGPFRGTRPPVDPLAGGPFVVDPVVVLRTLSQARNCCALRTAAEIVPVGERRVRCPSARRRFQLQQRHPEMACPARLPEPSRLRHPPLQSAALLGPRHPLHGSGPDQDRLPRRLFSGRDLSVGDRAWRPALGLPTRNGPHSASRRVALASTDYWSEPIDCTGIYPYG